MFYQKSKEMAESFELILDRCLDRIRGGEAVETILSEYPEYADRLRPLLDTAVNTTSAFSLTPSAETKLAWKQKFNEALVARRESRRTTQPWFRRSLFRYTAWAVTSTVVIALIITLVGIPHVVSPVWPVFTPDTPTILGTPSPDGNFAFYISDDVNAIADFKSVVIDISKVGLQKSDTGEWVEFQPTETTVDLVKLPGDVVQEVWRGLVPVGEYKQVFIYVDNVTGTLDATGQITEIKLPSSKLHMSVPFTVSDDAVTGFTYDLTVFATSNVKNVKYILKPQIGESGTTKTPRELKEPTENQGTSDNRTRQNPPKTTKPLPSNKPTKKQD
jgi:hypothetical protein